jgi:hypothetical protein
MSAPFQNCVRWSRLPTKMSAKLKIEKKGDEIIIVHCCFSVSQNELSRYIPIMQIRHILIKDHTLFFLFLAWRTSWLEVGIIGHNFGRGPSKDHSTKVWLQLAQWLLRRIFWWEFPIGFNQTLVKWSLGGPLPKLCLVFQTSDQDGRHSRTYLT